MALSYLLKKLILPHDIRLVLLQFCRWSFLEFLVTRDLSQLPPFPFLRVVNRLGLVDLRDVLEVLIHFELFLFVEFLEVVLWGENTGSLLGETFNRFLKRVLFKHIRFSISWGFCLLETPWSVDILHLTECSSTYGPSSGLLFVLAKLMHHVTNLFILVLYKSLLFT